MLTLFGISLPGANLQLAGCKAVRAAKTTGKQSLMRPLFALAAAGLLLGFSFNTAFADNTLSQNELRRLFPGSFDAVVYGILDVKIIAHGNGELIGLFSGKKDTGRWSVTNGRLCIMLSRWTDGKSSCSEVVASNGWYRGNGVRFKKF